MKASDVPYQLRPNKFIDRELFLDLLNRLVHIKGVDKYVYISMGGRRLTDHSAIYRKIGINKLYSFDEDPEAVARQLINRPIDTTVCEEMSSKNLPGQLGAITKKFNGAKNRVVWLDYTNPNSRIDQLQEMQEVLLRLVPGDFLRITLNAANGREDWDEDQGSEFRSPEVSRAEHFRSLLGAFFPSTVKLMRADDLPGVLAQCIELAVSSVKLRVNKISFEPLLTTCYKDGARMMTCTIAVVEKGAAAEDLRSNLAGWKFKSEDWTDVKWINAPDFSIKEKLLMEQSLSENPEHAITKLGFQPAKTKIQAVAAIESFQEFHRYYPSFFHVDAQ